MLGWLKTIISGGASTLVDSVGSAIDKCVTSDQERLELKNQLEAIVSANKLAMEKEAHDYELSYEKEITNRHKLDMNSDSWLSKNVRPLALIFLTTTTVILAYTTIFMLPIAKITLLTPWISLLTALLLTVYGFYFSSRAIEKWTSIKNKGKNE